MALQTALSFRYRTVPHGEANAILLPHTMQFNLDASAERQALIAQAMGLDTSAMSAEQAGLTAADAVAAMVDVFAKYACFALPLPYTIMMGETTREATQMKTRRASE